MRLIGICRVVVVVVILIVIGPRRTVRVWR
jgi:hypothetical protein